MKVCFLTTTLTSELLFLLASIHIPSCNSRNVPMGPVAITSSQPTTTLSTQVIITGSFEIETSLTQNTSSQFSIPPARNMPAPFQPQIGLSATNSGPAQPQSTEMATHHLISPRSTQAGVVATSPQQTSPRSTQAGVVATSHQTTSLQSTQAEALATSPDSMLEITSTQSTMETTWTAESSSPEIRPSESSPAGSREPTPQQSTSPPAESSPAGSRESTPQPSTSPPAESSPAGSREPTSQPSTSPPAESSPAGSREPTPQQSTSPPAESSPAGSRESTPQPSTSPPAESSPAGSREPTSQQSTSPPAESSPAGSREPTPQQSSSPPAESSPAGSREPTPQPSTSPPAESSPAASRGSTPQQSTSPPAESSPAGSRESTPQQSTSPPAESSPAGSREPTPQQSTSPPFTASHTSSNTQRPTERSAMWESIARIMENKAPISIKQPNMDLVRFKTLRINISLSSSIKGRPYTLNIGNSSMNKTQDLRIVHWDSSQNHILEVWVLIASLLTDTKTVKDEVCTKSMADSSSDLNNCSQIYQQIGQAAESVCRELKVCDKGYTCLTMDETVCVSLCGSINCGENNHCTLDQNFKPICVCDIGDEFVLGSTDCKEAISQRQSQQSWKKSAIGGFTVSGICLLALLVIFIIFFRHITKSRKAKLTARVVPDGSEDQSPRIDTFQRARSV